MVAMVDFLYYGEAKVHQEKLDSFLAISEELQLKGLQRSNDQNQTNEVELQQEEPLPTKQNYRPNQTKATTKESLTPKEQSGELKRVENKELAITIPMTVSADLQHLDETVKSMMETSQKMFPIGNRQVRGKICKVCGKEGLPADIMRHIEANHVEGVEIPCNQCDKICRSRNGLWSHISKHHRHQ